MFTPSEPRRPHQSEGKYNTSPIRSTVQDLVIVSVCSGPSHSMFKTQSQYIQDPVTVIVCSGPSHSNSMLRTQSQYVQGPVIVSVCSGPSHSHPVTVLVCSGPSHSMFRTQSQYVPDPVTVCSGPGHSIYVQDPVTVCSGLSHVMLRTQSQYVQDPVTVICSGPSHSISMFRTKSQSPIHSIYVPDSVTVFSGLSHVMLRTQSQYVQDPVTVICSGPSHSISMFRTKSQSPIHSIYVPDPITLCSGLSHNMLRTQSQ